MPLSGRQIPYHIKGTGFHPQQQNRKEIRAKMKQRLESDTDDEFPEFHGSGLSMENSSLRGLTRGPEQVGAIGTGFC